MKNTVRLRRNILYTLLQGTFCVIFCAANLYAGIYLTQKGYSSSEIGIIISIGNIIGIILQPIVASYTDNVRTVPQTTILLCLTLITGLNIASFLG
jgi:PPP family 3-phenylpropionic acid transporter